MDLGDKENAVCRNYIAQGWVYELFDWIGILRALGPMDTGKTRLVDMVLSPVAFRPFEIVGSESEANMRRKMIDFHRAGRRTFLCDDVAFDCSPTSERADNLINRCQQGGKATYLEQDDRCWVSVVEVVFGPTILGCRNAFSDVAIESRCLDIAVGAQQRTQRNLPAGWDGTEKLIAECFDEFRKEAIANLTSYLRDLSEDLMAEKTAEPAVLVLSAIVALSAESGSSGMTLPDPPKPISLKAIRDQIWSANRVAIADVQIGKILRQWGFKNKAHIYESGGYTKLRGINWQRLK